MHSIKRQADAEELLEPPPVPPAISTAVARIQRIWHACLCCSSCLQRVTSHPCAVPCMISSVKAPRAAAQCWLAQSSKTPRSYMRLTLKVQTAVQGAQPGRHPDHWPDAALR